MSSKLKKVLLNTDNYPYEDWQEKYPDCIVNLKDLYVHVDWEDFIEEEYQKGYFKKLEKVLSQCVKNSNKIYPHPGLLFNALNSTPMRRVKVAILGQDPYFDSEVHHNKNIPQAMGLSFSVPYGIDTPSSLKNVYKNLIKYKHINKMPKHGNLISWAYQGCLLLNASLTVIHGKQNKNCHAEFWRSFTTKMIKYISSECKNVVFILWGAFALKKKRFIDENKHLVIVSSHPSGLSYNKPMKEHPAFCNQDHFGIANKYLIEHNKKPIIWRL